MRLLDRAGRIDGGRVLFDGRDIARAGRADLRRLRGSAMSMIFQNPRAALNPIHTVERQVADVLAAHGRPRDRGQVLGLLRAVLIRDPERRLRAYPHELSGGMCQRVVIAMAIACEPALLIADEPTTGLDVTTQQAVMELLARIQRERGMALILITHDLGLAARWCGRIAVMERGRVVEHGPTARWFEGAARTHGGFDVALVDLADFNLPIYDEPKHPRMRQYEHEHTKRWSESVAAADAFVFVTPEYNYATSPALLNALDYLVVEWGLQAGRRGQLWRHCRRPARRDAPQADAHHPEDDDPARRRRHPELRRPPEGRRLRQQRPDRPERQKHAG